MHFINDNSDNRRSDEGAAGRAAGFGKAGRRPDRTADNPPDPISSLLFLFFWWGSG